MIPLLHAATYAGPSTSSTVFLVGCLLAALVCVAILVGGRRPARERRPHGPASTADTGTAGLWGRGPSGGDAGGDVS